MADIADDKMVLAVIPIPPSTMTKEEVIEFCAHFHCVATPVKDTGYYEVRTLDPINLFWLGANFMMPTETAWGQTPLGRIKEKRRHG